MRKKLKLQLNLNLKLIQNKTEVKPKHYEYSFEKNYIKKCLNTQQNQNLKNKNNLMHAAAPNSPAHKSPAQKNPCKSKEPHNEEIERNDELNDSEMKNMSEKVLTNKSSTPLNKIPPPPPLPQDEHETKLMLKFEQEGDRTVNYQAAYDVLVNSGFRDVKILEKKVGFLFKFKTKEQKKEFLKNKELVGLFGKPTNYKAQRNQNEAILLGIDERYNSLLLMLNSYHDEFIKSQIRNQLEGVSEAIVNLKNKVSFLVLNNKKKPRESHLLKKKNWPKQLGEAC